MLITSNNETYMQTISDHMSHGDVGTLHYHQECSHFPLCNNSLNSLPTDYSLHTMCRWYKRLEIFLVKEYLAVWGSDRLLSWLKVIELDTCLCILLLKSILGNRDKGA